MTKKRGILVTWYKFTFAVRRKLGKVDVADVWGLKG